MKLTSINISNSAIFLEFVHKVQTHFFVLINISCLFYFSLKNAMVYIKKIKLKTTLVYVFQKYMVNNEKLQQQVISSSIYTSLFLNSDLYVHSIMWGKSFRLEYYYLAGFQYLWLTNISVIIDAVSGFFSGIDILFINR